MRGTERPEQSDANRCTGQVLGRAECFMFCKDRNTHLGIHYSKSK